MTPPETFLGSQTLITIPPRAAVIFGVTGLVGKELARKMISNPEWKLVYGVARRPEPDLVESSKYRFIACDLLDPLETRRKVSELEDVTHMFWVTWASQFPLDSPECCEQNKAMMGNALNALLPRATSLRHVSLQTGLKHYVSLSRPSLDVREAWRFDEGCPRAIESCNNFYYGLEDLLRERLDGKVAWSVHRPGLIMGSSYKTLYNFMGSLCVYGTICKYMNLPFTFGGMRERWEEVSIDGSDARLVADQHIWAATMDMVASTDGQAFNSVNGPSFTWKEIWPSIGKKFGLQVQQEAMFEQDYWYSSSMAGKEKVWREIVQKEGLVKTEMEDLANWGFLDVLFRCPVKLLGTRDKVDRMGFGTRYETLESIVYWIDVMRHDKLIP